MATAVLDEVIDSQPCRIPGAGAPRRALGRVPDLAERLLSPAQVAAVADAMPDRYRALVLAAAWSGLRQGELLALTRADLDLTATPALVRVRRAARRSDNGTMQVDLPKTTASLRTVTLAAPLATALAAHLDEFVAPGRDTLVFTTATGTNRARSNLNDRSAEPSRLPGCHRCGSTTCATWPKSSPPKPALLSPSSWHVSDTPAPRPR
jgi:integrase